MPASGKLVEAVRVTGLSPTSDARRGGATSSGGMDREGLLPDGGPAHHRAGLPDAVDVERWDQPLERLATTRPHLGRYRSVRRPDRIPRRVKQERDRREDGAFDLRVLHFRRTFVEKMFAIHGKVERFRTEAARVGRNSRHYADLYVLAEKDEVLQMLNSDEYADICKDYDEKSRRFFANSYRPPRGLHFRDS